MDNSWDAGYLPLTRFAVFLWGRTDGEDDPNRDCVMYRRARTAEQAAAYYRRRGFRVWKAEVAERRPAIQTQATRLQMEAIR
jgi:hypothetical protein